MIKKYETVKKDVIEYVHNRLKADVTPDEIVSEVTSKFPVFVAFFKCEPDMIQELVYWLIDQAFFYQNGRFYGEVIPAGMETGTPAYNDRLPFDDDSGR